jgi:stringent starvation protein B
MGDSPNTPPEDRPSKQVAFRAFLQEGFVSIHLDARRPGVVVPPEFAGSPHLVLQYGLAMPIPIPDLEVTETGISATLSFARQPQKTVVPWGAIYIVACEDGRGVLYYEDVPEEVSLVARPVPGGPGLARDADAPAPLAPLRSEAQGTGPLEAEIPAETGRRFLRSVPLDAVAPAARATAPLARAATGAVSEGPEGQSDAPGSPPDARSEDAAAPKLKRRRRPTLKLVK